MFVGRGRELGELGRALDEAAAGNGATALVSGEAGIGKTCLATELATRADDAGFEVLVGRCIDLVGADLPYQPFVEALRSFGAPWEVEEQTPNSQLRVFEQTLTLLTERAGSAPVLLMLEDLHWADTSTLDLVVFLAHSLHDRPILLLATYRADEPGSAERMRRLSDGIRRSTSKLIVELRPLDPEQLAALLAARAEVPLPAEVTEAIVARSEGNPFFAEELLAAAVADRGELPPNLRDLLLQRVDRLDVQTRGLLRLAAAAGHEVKYSLLLTTAGLPENDVRESLRRAIENGVLVSEQEASSFRFRHALLAEAIYATILPGEREELHARLATELARGARVAPAELAHHWGAARRPREALVTSLEAARQAQSVFGLAEAHAHLERALDLWPEVPDAANLSELDFAQLCAWTAELADKTGASPRAVELAQRAIELIGTEDPHRAALLHVRLGEYLHATVGIDAGLVALKRAVELVPTDPPSAARAYSLGSLAGGLMVDWRYSESLPIAEQALAIARSVGAPEAVVRARTVVGGDLAYLGRADEGLAELRQALLIAEKVGDHVGRERAYVLLTDVLTMLGRPQESARVGQAAIEVMHPYGIDSTLLISNQIEALLAMGDWDGAETFSTAALRNITSSFPYWLFIIRADLEIGRGEFGAARAHLEAAEPIVLGDAAVAQCKVIVSKLALWEHRWADADKAVAEGMARVHFPDAAQLRVGLCANGLRAQAELAALAHARRDFAGHQAWLDSARQLIETARAAAGEAAAITPNAAGWLVLAEAEYERASGGSPRALWPEAAAAWELLERPPVAVYCRWREAEALVTAGASRADASAPLRDAYAVAVQLGAKPLLRELELLAQRARLDLAPPSAGHPDGPQGIEETLGLTSREAQVLDLVARGLTNREIAASLVISDKTASVHVSHILRKLGVSTRVEAAAIAHRQTPMSSDQPTSRT